MSKTVNDWAELKKEIMRRANKSLRINVAAKVKEKIITHVQTDVYNAYSPVEYNRRKNSGGLADKQNIYTLMDKNTLIVQDMTPLDDPRFPYNGSYENGSLSQIIEAGAYNPWAKYGARDGAWTEPRPFMTNAQKDIKEHPEDIIQELKNDIENGI